MMVIDEKETENEKHTNTYKSLLKELEIDERVNEKEKCNFISNGNFNWKRYL